MDKISERVNNRLKEMGKSRKELSEFLGVSDYGLAKMLTRETFKSETMDRMVKFLNVDFSFFGVNKAEGISSVSANKQVELVSDLKTKIEYLERVIATKDEVIRSKDELIATLREKLKP
jgi:transcriptional regulator with XRE-family HTH domain